MNNFLIKALSFFLTMYFASLIIFPLYYSYIRYIFDALVIITFIFLMFTRKEKIYQLNSVIILYALFAILVLAGSLWGVDFKSSGLISVQLFLIVINLFVFYNLMKEFKLQNTLLNGVLLGALVNYLLLLGIVDVSFPLYSNEWATRASGTAGNSNVLAIMMLISILASIIYLNQKVPIRKSFFYYQYLNLVLAIYIIFLTASKKGLIGVTILIGTYILLSMTKPKNILPLIVFGMIGFFAVINYLGMETIEKKYNFTIGRFAQVTGKTKSLSTEQRAYHVEHGWKLFQEKPLLGYGLGGYASLNKTGVYAHNNYIELLTGVGLIGFLFFYSIYFFIFKKIYKMKNGFLGKIFFMFLVILLLMDMALVSYKTKILIYTLLFILIYAENDSKERLPSNE